MRLFKTVTILALAVQYISAVKDYGKVIKINKCCRTKENLEHNGPLIKCLESTENDENLLMSRIHSINSGSVTFAYAVINPDVTKNFFVDAITNGQTISVTDDGDLEIDNGVYNHEEYCLDAAHNDTKTILIVIRYDEKLLGISNLLDAFEQNGGTGSSSIFSILNQLLMFIRFSLNCGGIIYAYWSCWQTRKRQLSWKANILKYCTVVYSSVITIITLLEPLEVISAHQYNAFIYGFAFFLMTIVASAAVMLFWTNSTDSDSDKTFLKHILVFIGISFLFTTIYWAYGPKGAKYLMELQPALWAVKLHETERAETKNSNKLPLVHRMELLQLEDNHVEMSEFN